MCTLTPDLYCDYRGTTFYYRATTQAGPKVAVTAEFYCHERDFFEFYAQICTKREYYKYLFHFLTIPRLPLLSTYTGKRYTRLKKCMSYCDIIYQTTLRTPLVTPGKHFPHWKPYGVVAVSGTKPKPNTKQSA